MKLLFCVWIRDYRTWQGIFSRITGNSNCKRRLFRYVENINRSTNQIFKPIQGIRSVHQVQSTKASPGIITIRNLSCYTFKQCGNYNYQHCENADLSTKIVTVKRGGNSIDEPTTTSSSSLTELITEGSILALYTDETEDYYVFRVRLYIQFYRL